VQAVSNGVLVNVDTVAVHIIIEIFEIGLHAYFHSDPPKKGVDLLESHRDIGDQHRRWTLAHVGANVLEDFAASSDADAISFTQEQGQGIQQICQSMVTFLHEHDWRDAEEFSVSEGYLISTTEEKWSYIRPAAEEFLESYRTALKYGDPFIYPEISTGERPTGPVRVESADVYNLFLTPTCPESFLVHARGEPVSRAD
jgi:hypothetical protein